MNTVNEQAIARRVRGVRTLGLVVSAAVLLLVAFGRGNAYIEAREMLAEGVATQALVVQKKHWIESGRKGRESDRYALVYRFSDGAGKPFEREVRVSEAVYLSTTDGAEDQANGAVPSRLEILYRRADPNTSDLRQSYQRKASLLTIAQDLLVTLAIALGATFLIGFLTGRSLRRRMLRAQLAN